MRLSEVEANEKADALAAELTEHFSEGEPWEPVVWENLGWHYCAKLGQFEVTPSLIETEWRCSFSFAPPLFATKKAPRHAVKLGNMIDFGSSPIDAVWNTINAFLQSMNENIVHIARLYER